MTAFAIGGRPFRLHDGIRHMSGGRHGRRRHRHYGPGYAFGRRAGRGDIRAAILALLAEQPMHGYQIIQELTERTGGMWRPSPGPSTRRCSSSRTRTSSARPRPSRASASTS